jgi:hypothetical protein
LALVAMLGLGILVVSWAMAQPPQLGAPKPSKADDPPAQENRTGIPYHELNWKYDVLGKSGRPLGELVTVQGQVVEGYFKGYEGGPNILLQRINGTASQDRIQIKLVPYADENAFRSLRLDKTYELRGYEGGEYQGIPSEAMREEGGIWRQTTAHHFAVYFRVLKAKEIPEIRWGPSDFLDRFAAIEGTAQSDGGKGFLVGGGWKLLVLEYGGWPKHVEGKLVEAEGVMRNPGGVKGVFRLDNGRSRLVRLEDQVGREVELDGHSFSLNGQWWFDYRGTQLHVEDMDKLPNWKDKHGQRLVISGVLEEAMLPRLDQIGLKPNPDLAKSFIVRKASWRPYQRLEVK